MVNGRKTRLTRDLTTLLAERVAGCNLCASTRAQAYAEDICKRLHFSSAESNRVRKNFTCPNCEAGPHSYGTLAEWENGEWSDISRSRRWHRQHAGKINSLAKYLEKHPSVGLLHPAAQTILNAVKRAPCTIVEIREWWRACCTEKESVPPDSRFMPSDTHEHQIPPGRFHHAGQMSFYAAGSHETSAIEVLRKLDGSVWIAGITFNKPLRVLDVRSRMLGDKSPLGFLLAGLNFSELKIECDKAPREYLVTRLIADLVRLRPSLEGILYTSSVCPLSENLVVLKRVALTVSTPPRRYEFTWSDFDSRMRLTGIDS